MAANPRSTEADERKERLRRRLVAARVLAGLGQKELADKIKRLGHERGFSARTIGDMERGGTPIQPQAIPVLAEACAVAPAFFHVDLANLTDDDEPEKLADRVSELEAQLADDAARLAQLEAAVRRLDAKDHPEQDEEGG